MEWLGEHAWAAWLVLAAVLGMAELVSLDLVLAMLAVGALAGAVPAVLGAGVVVQLIVAGAASVAMLGLVRPNLIAHLHSGPDLTLGTAKLIGQRAVVTQRITGMASGQVQLAGETWTAAPYDETLTIEPGATVEVFAIRGATALVHPLPELGP